MSEQNFATIAGLRCISLRTSLTARLTSGAIAADPPPKVSAWVTAAKGEAVQMAITRVPEYAVPYAVCLVMLCRGILSTYSAGGAPAESCMRARVASSRSP